MTEHHGSQDVGSWDIERLLWQLLLIVLTVLWAKLAYDVLFDFGPEDARSWFPPYAVISAAAFALVVSVLNIYLLARPHGWQASAVLAKRAKALVVASLLASIFGCWASETRIKFADIYVIVPALILLVVTTPEDGIPAWRRWCFMLLSVLLLIPNDKCEKPQNWWWVINLGASPLTYALPVNVLVCVTGCSLGKVAWWLLSVLVGLYYCACVYHRLVGGY
ncbi:MAG: hypothetical protein ACYS76_04695 [Planctomycetota bacterium]